MWIKRRIGVSSRRSNKRSSRASSIAIRRISNISGSYGNIFTERDLVEFRRLVEIVDMIVMNWFLLLLLLLMMVVLMMVLMMMMER